MSPLVVAGIVLVFVVVLVVIPVVALLAQRRRAQRQSITVRNGTLSTDDGIGTVLRGLPVGEIGAIAVLPKRRRRAWEPVDGIWTYGGLLVLDRAGRVVRHVISIPGSSLPLEDIAAEIPAPVHRTLDLHSRAAFLRAFPGSLRFGQLWGPARTIGAVAGVVIVALLIVIVIAAVIPAATGA